MSSEINDSFVRRTSNYLQSSQISFALHDQLRHSKTNAA